MTTMYNWVQITSGQGPDECCWVVAKVVEAIVESASTNGYQMRLLEIIPADRPNLFKSALLSLEGPNVSGFLSQWQGTIQWIGKSPFRPAHKRKNWFIGISSYTVPQETEYNVRELKFESMRSSGPGGQHVNKTESAIRVTHLPTGISAVAQEERSQQMNRKLALSRLSQKLQQQREQKECQVRQDRWSDHSLLERGNPVRIYEGASFKLKKVYEKQQP